MTIAVDISGKDNIMGLVDVVVLEGVINVDVVNLVNDGTLMV